MLTRFDSEKATFFYSRYMTNIILRHLCDLWEAEGAKLAEKAVTKLEDYKDIYDDPDDAYLADMQSLFDQQAVEAGHVPPPDPHAMGYDDGRSALVSLYYTQWLLVTQMKTQKRKMKI